LSYDWTYWKIAGRPGRIGLHITLEEHKALREEEGLSCNDVEESLGRDRRSVVALG
jgi:hypothetical protein